MSDQHTSEAEKLGALRAKIDAVDETMHHLLMQRAGVIDALIEIKGAASNKGAAFRPGREAAMMEVLSRRHNGSIPFGMIAHMWREIISTFTWLQANYNVHIIANDAALRDLARFQFGFTVPLNDHANLAAVLAATKQQVNAIALVGVNSDDAWWSGLGASNGLMIMARLPIHPVGFDAPDAFAVAPPLSDPTPFDVRLYGGRIKSIDDAQSWPDGMLVASANDGAVLIALHEGQKAPLEMLDIWAVGGYFAPVLAL